MTKEKSLDEQAKEMMLERTPKGNKRYSYIGALIRLKINENGMKVVAFADRKEISRDRTTMYGFFKRESWREEDLETIGEVLNYDFVSAYRKYNQEKKSAGRSQETSKNSLLVKVDGKVYQRIALPDEYNELETKVVRV